jgi:hypothetical protein
MPSAGVLLQLHCTVAAGPVAHLLAVDGSDNSIACKQACSMHKQHCMHGQVLFIEFCLLLLQC